jgi:hypothetical protein
VTRRPTPIFLTSAQMAKEYRLTKRDKRIVKAAMMLPKPLTPEECEIQRRLFNEAIAPITALKVHLYSIYLPTVIMDSTGKIISSAYPDEMQEQIAKLDKIIEEIAASWTARP